MKVEKIGVIGCGIMGSGIAQVCAQSGYQVFYFRRE
jgi:3-hydroxybutyryl-CoA dehydrogenase